MYTGSVQTLPDSSSGQGWPGCQHVSCGWTWVSGCGCVGTPGCMSDCESGVCESGIGSEIGSGSNDAASSDENEILNEIWSESGESHAWIDAESCCAISQSPGDCGFWSGTPVHDQNRMSITEKGGGASYTGSHVQSSFSRIQQFYCRELSGGPDYSS